MMALLVAALTASSSPLFVGVPTSDLLNLASQSEVILHLCEVPAPKTRAQMIFIRRELVDRLGVDGYLEAMETLVPIYRKTVEITGINYDKCGLLQ